MGADILQVEVSVLRSAIERMRQLYPELEDDAELLSGMIDGSTNFDGVMNKLALAFMDTSALKAANAEVQKAVRDRGERFDRRAEGYRALMFDLMKTASRQMMTLPVATVSIAKGRPRLVIDNEDELPQGYVKTERVPMRADIAAALSTGDQIPGAHLEPTSDHLAVRTK